MIALKRRSMAILLRRTLYGRKSCVSPLSICQSSLLHHLENDRRKEQERNNGHKSRQSRNEKLAFLCPMTPVCRDHVILPSFRCQQHRAASSSSWLPEAASNITIWGGSGLLITTLHVNGAVPYWACMSLCCFILRTSLLPLVIKSAHTSAQFAAVAPEVQFVLTLFQQDRKMMQMDKRMMKGSKESLQLQVEHFKATWRNLGYIYKRNNVHPLDIFKVRFCFQILLGELFLDFTVSVRASDSV